MPDAEAKVVRLWAKDVDGWSAMDATATLGLNGFYSSMRADLTAKPIRDARARAVRAVPAEYFREIETSAAIPRSSSTR